MNMHCTLNGGVGSLCIHLIQQDVNEFVAAIAEDCATQELF
jgi:hypothetical protein